MGASDAARGLRRKVEEYPLVFLGAALGAGYVAGGGLRSAISGQVMRFGGGLAWKFVVLPAIATTLTRLLGGGAEGGSPQPNGEGASENAAPDE